MKMIAAAAAGAAMIAAASAGHAVEFVTNGSFTSLTNGLGQLGYNTEATGWTTSGYNFVMTQADQGSSGQYGGLSLWDAANNGTSTWNGLTASGMGNFVAMDGDFSVGPLQQTVTGLTAGKVYKLTFQYAFGQQTGFNGDTLQYITETFGSNQTFTSSTFTVPSHGFTGWQTYTTTVKADGTSDVLSFLATGNLPVPPFALVSAVSLSAPEPASWALMIVGVGMVGALARRRRLATLAGA